MPGRVMDEGAGDGSEGKRVSPPGSTGGGGQSTFTDCQGSNARGATTEMPVPGKRQRKKEGKGDAEILTPDEQLLRVCTGAEPSRPQGMCVGHTVCRGAPRLMAGMHGGACEQR